MGKLARLGPYPPPPRMIPGIFAFRNFFFSVLPQYSRAAVALLTMVSSSGMEEQTLCWDNTRSNQVCAHSFPRALGTPAPV